MYFSNPKGWNIIQTNALWKAAEYCKNAKITSGSYKELLKDKGNILHYCDPPYMKDTELPKSSQLYRHSFTLEDHEELAHHNLI